MENIGSFNCYCKECYDSSSVCDFCKQKGQISHHPAMRICRLFKKSKIKCVNRAIPITRTDYEEGNKAMVLSFEKEIEEGTIHPFFSF